MKKRIFAYLVFAFGFVGYLFTLENGVGLIDSGELAMAAKSLGIAHPTGYPLYTILGRLFTLILPIESVLATSFMSLFFGSLTGVLIYLFILSATNSKGKELVAFSAALIFLFSRTFWLASTGTEVYALDSFLDLLMIYLFWIGFSKGNGRLLILGGLVTGLSFGNHMHTVLYIPALMLLFFWNRKRLSVVLFMETLLFFILGLSIYLYLPLRASADPVVNWGNPENWHNFVRHVSGWQYRVWMFEKGSGALKSNIGVFWSLLSSQNWILMPILLILGIVLNIRHRKRLLFFLVIMGIDFIYSINYSIPDIDTYYIPFFMSTVLLFGLGIASIKDEKKKIAATVGVFILAITSFIVNFDRKDSFAEELAYLFLTAAPQNSIVIIDNWDIYAPAHYIQCERGYREDVVLVDFALLKRSWYVEQLLLQYPEKFKKADPYIRLFIERVTPFERRKVHDPQKIEAAYREMIFAMVGFSVNAGRPVALFVDWKPLNDRFTTRANGLYRILAEEKVHVLPEGLFDLPEMGLLDERRRYLVELVGRQMAGGVARLQEMGETDRAIDLAIKLYEIDRSNLNFIQNIGVLHIYAERYDDAHEWFQKLEGSIPREKMKLIYDDLEKRKRDKILEDERNRQ